MGVWKRIDAESPIRLKGHNKIGDADFLLEEDGYWPGKNRVKRNQFHLLLGEMFVGSAR